MDSDIDLAMRREAIGWLVRLRDAEDADWLHFEQWLAQNPGHAAAYREIEDLDIDIGPLLDRVNFHGAANDDALAGRPGLIRRRWLVGGGALAAMVLAALAIVPQFLHDRYEVRSGNGETRIVSLESGTRVTLNGNSRIILDRKDPRFAELSSGEALFEVRHDARRPFHVLVGRRVVEDAGTVFNLAYEGSSLRLAVAEGKVIYAPGAGQTELEAGEGLETSADGTNVVIGAVRKESVGGWRQGELTYQGEPLSTVAADLSRLLGVAVRVDPAIAARPYFGTILLRRGDATQLQALMAALDVEAVSDGNGITMKPRGDGIP